MAEGEGGVEELSGGDVTVDLEATRAGGHGGEGSGKADDVIEEKEMGGFEGEGREGVGRELEVEGGVEG